MHDWKETVVIVKHYTFVESWVSNSAEPNRQLLEDQRKHSAGNRVLPKGSLHLTRPSGSSSQLSKGPLQSQVLWQCRLSSKTFPAHEILWPSCLATIFHTWWGLQGAWKIRRSCFLLQEKSWAESRSPCCWDASARAWPWPASLCECIHIAHYLCTHLYRTWNDLLSHWCNEWMTADSWEVTADLVFLNFISGTETTDQYSFAGMHDLNCAFSCVCMYVCIIMLKN